MKRRFTLRLMLPAALLLALLAACGLPPEGAEPTVALTQQPPVAADLVLSWERVGGIAGFCDQLSVTSDWQATANTCDGTLIADDTLDDAQRAQLETWRAQYGSATFTQDDGAVADSMSIELSFQGSGSGEPPAAVLEEMNTFAGLLFSDVSSTREEASVICRLTANSDVTVYQRPSAAAQQFGVLAAAETVQPTHRSPDGWYGFEPGVAQAANVGVFRLRWIAPDADVTQESECLGLEEAPALDATACYTMAMADVVVRATPAADGDALATLPAEGYVLLDGVSADGGWYRADLAYSSQPQPAGGWVSAADVNFNGACDALATVEGE